MEIQFEEDHSLEKVREQWSKTGKDEETKSQVGNSEFPSPHLMRNQCVVKTT